MDIEHIDTIKLKLEKSIGNSLYNHCLRTANEAEKLANNYGISKDKAYVAGLLHDCGKNKFNISEKTEKNDKNKNNDNLIHSHIGASLATEEYNISDEDIINAIKYHTTGRENMSLLEKVIFIADKIE
ncbi:MAG: metal dependent phosphohydrolase, partial [Bacillota bacterium]|nr:metal dependent phosphohydrolase [Bacillota bacterium]